LVFDLCAKQNMRRTKEQMYQLVAQWEQSGKTLKDFSRENQITLACLGYWLKKRTQAATQVDAPDFFHQWRRQEMAPVWWD
jgi:adenosyl cobinamide kinase/adenosyl cobinamide phosphate guanylyltransferase